ncbi:MAG TPA: hypothetical protein EYN79_06525 [Planctomycetes bacterium]|nr:hypothetical protein [Planctomycetota bacterium]
MNVPSADCQKVRVRIEHDGTGAIEPLEARWLEVHLESCSDCQEWFSADTERVGEAMEELAGQPVASFEPVSEEEWHPIDAALRRHGALGTARVGAWRAFVPLAAALFLCFLVVQSISQQGFEGPQDEIGLTAEILDLPPGSQSFILTPGDEDGGVIIFVTSG